MDEIQIGDIVVFRGTAFNSGALTGHEQEGRVIGLKGDECAIEQIYVSGKTKFLRKPIKTRYVMIRKLSDVIKDQSGEIEA